MPYLQMIGEVQDEDGDGGQPGGQVADHHHEFAVVAVNDGAGQRAEKQHRSYKEEAHERQRGGRAGDLVGPYRQSKTGHVGAQ